MASLLIFKNGNQRLHIVCVDWLNLTGEIYSVFNNLNMLFAFKIYKG